MEMRHIFIIGSKGIPSRYGGFETFVENLTKHQKNKEIKYHVSCIETEEMKDRGADFEHNGAHCFQIKLPSIGAAKAVLYDILSFRQSIKIIKKDIFGALICTSIVNILYLCKELPVIN